MRGANKSVDSILHIEVPLRYLWNPAGNHKRAHKHCSAEVECPKRDDSPHVEVVVDAGSKNGNRCGKDYH